MSTHDVHDAVEVDLPRAGGLRPAAEQLLEPFLSDLRGHPVVLNARRLTNGTISYADGLVSVLADAGVTSVLLVGAYDGFAELVSSAASEHNLSNFEVISADAMPATRVLGHLLPA